MRQVISRTIFCLAVGLTLAPFSLAQQTVAINWVTKQPISPPITVDKSTVVVVTVEHINDMLYSYSERVVATPRLVSGILPGIERIDSTKFAANDPCKALSDSTQKLDTAFQKPELNPAAGNSAVPKSIPFETTRAAYADARKAIDSLQGSIGSCQDATLLARKGYYDTVENDWDAKMNLPHVFKFTTTLAPLTDYSIYLLEQYNGKITDACTDKDSSGNTVGVECKVVYSPVSTVITTSGGFLFSTLPARSYERRTVPGGTEAVLVVNNRGPVRSALTALVNIKLPWPVPLVCPSNDESFGCAFSIGPAFIIDSGTQQATRLGLFTGFSIHMWKYLYLTPGVHVGQFDDFPAGFTADRQSIPASFTGQLQPVSRNTVRFAVGVTFKGWDLLKQSSTQQGTAAKGTARQEIARDQPRGRIDCDY